jgi:serine protein kinase
MTMKDGASLLRLVGDMQDQKRFQELNWSGSFQDYLNIVSKNPWITRNAFQRIYDMIMEFGYEEFEDAKKRLIRYKFFSDTNFDGDKVTAPKNEYCCCTARLVPPRAPSCAA